MLQGVLFIRYFSCFIFHFNKGTRVHRNFLYFNFREVTKHNSFYVLISLLHLPSISNSTFTSSFHTKSNNSFKYSIYFTALLSLLPFQILNSKNKKAFHCVKVPRLIFDLRFPICNYKLYFTSYTSFLLDTQPNCFGFNLYALCLHRARALCP